MRLLSRIWPGFSGEPSLTSSSPVLSTATRGRATACTISALTLASTPATAGVITVPAGYKVVPARTSSPTPRTDVAQLHRAEHLHPRAAVDAFRVLHHHDGISAGGNGRSGHDADRLPGWSTRSVWAPAATSPTTGISTGEPAPAAAIEDATTA